jgi:hypothetical protein
MSIESSYRQLLDERVPQLEAIGFELKVTYDSVWYERDGIKIPTPLILGARYWEWDKFIKDHTPQNSNQ